MPYSNYQLAAEEKKLLFKGVISRSDKVIIYFLLGSFLFGLMLCPVYDTWLVGIGIGMLNLIAWFGTKMLLPKSTMYQYVGSAVMAIFMAQFIYQMHGMFEMHFFAFVACTVMITYSNWRLQIPLFLIIVIHHSIFAYLQFSG